LKDDFNVGAGFKPALWFSLFCRSLCEVKDSPNKSLKFRFIDIGDRRIPSRVCIVVESIGIFFYLFKLSEIIMCKDRARLV